eukprot:CAMPEP_0179141664 /NCGR_PEP_ID=MMETSP0796-20121207/67970_1 /TAXON_ID=73915 /ORGANISM="Pyrodinium bahamense, Strain pbaha01" /LENGTH=224 /DNA_ID=CAMNT_0020841429 /DNA_START=93 /DNA_END=764 /DNA_ORIENTATION=+
MSCCMAALSLKKGGLVESGVARRARDIDAAFSVARRLTKPKVSSIAGAIMSCVRNNGSAKNLNIAMQAALTEVPASAVLAASVQAAVPAGMAVIPVAAAAAVPATVPAAAAGSGHPCVDALCANAARAPASSMGERAGVQAALRPPSRRKAPGPAASVQEGAPRKSPEGPPLGNVVPQAPGVPCLATTGLATHMAALKSGDFSEKMRLGLLGGSALRGSAAEAA